MRLRAEVSVRKHAAIGVARTSERRHIASEGCEASRGTRALSGAQCFKRQNELSSGRSWRELIRFRRGVARIICA
jgi:hypothetical protein